MDKGMITSLGLPQKGPLMAALVGAGGKTTTMLALAREYKALNQSVLVTTTTRIYMPPPDFADAVIMGIEPSRMLSTGTKGTVTVMGEAVEGNGKVVGHTAQRLDAVYQARHFDVILVEADGSRGLPVKAPGAYEPIIPEACTHVIGLIGMDAFGQPATACWVHRLEEFLMVTGARSEQPIDGPMLKSLIDSPAGVFKNAPEQAQRILLLNKCSSDALTEAARSLIAGLEPGTVRWGTQR